MPSAGSGRSCIMVRKTRSRRREAWNGCVVERERLEEGEGRVHLFGLVSKKIFTVVTRRSLGAYTNEALKQVRDRDGYAVRHLGKKGPFLDRLI